VTNARRENTKAAWIVSRLWSPVTSETREPWIGSGGGGAMFGRARA